MFRVAFIGTIMQWWISVKINKIKFLRQVPYSTHIALWDVPTECNCPIDTVHYYHADLGQAMVSACPDVSCGHKKMQTIFAYLGNIMMQSEGNLSGTKLDSQFVLQRDFNLLNVRVELGNCLLWEYPTLLRTFRYSGKPQFKNVHLALQTMSSAMSMYTHTKAWDCRQLLTKITSHKQYLFWWRPLLL